MNCEKIKELLSRYIDDQLDPEERAVVEEHLKSCPDCAAYYERLLSLGRMADDFDIDGGESYWEKQKDAVVEKIEKLEAEKIVPVGKKSYRGLVYKLAAVAATIALIAYVSIDISNQIEAPQAVQRAIQPDESLMAVPQDKSEAGTEKDGEPVKMAMPRPETVEEVAGRQESAEPEGGRKGEITDDAAESGKKKERPDVSMPKVVTEELPVEIEAVMPTAIEAAKIPAVSDEAVIHSYSAPVKIEKVEKKGSPEKAAQGEADRDLDQLGRVSLPDESLKPDVVILQNLSAESEADKGPSVDEYMAAYDVEIQNAALAERGCDPELFDGFTEEQISSYIDSYDDARQLSQKYRGVLSSRNAVSKSALASKAYNSGSAEQFATVPIPAADSMDAIVRKMAGAFVRLGKITPIEAEKDQMLGYLRTLRNSADSNTIKDIDEYIDDLESETN